jgi:hypothetical protein
MLPPSHTPPPNGSPPPPEGGVPGVRLTDGFQFRAGQQAFLARWAEVLEQGQRNGLGVFVPGYGKTITALASFLVARALGVADRVVVFVPRGNLRDQYADAGDLAAVFRGLGAPPLTFCVADSDRVFLKNLDTDLVVTTYQYASGERGNEALLRYCRQSKALFVFDEVHHLADDGTWAQAIARFPHAASVALSGTPLRSDNKTLFGVPFVEDSDGIAVLRGAPRGVDARRARGGRHPQARRRPRRGLRHPDGPRRHRRGGGALALAAPRDRGDLEGGRRLPRAAEAPLPRGLPRDPARPGVRAVRGEAEGARPGHAEVRPPAARAVPQPPDARHRDEQPARCGDPRVRPAPLPRATPPGGSGRTSPPPSARRSWPTTARAGST